MIGVVHWFMQFITSSDGSLIPEVHWFVGHVFSLVRAVGAIHWFMQC